MASFSFIGSSEKAFQNKKAEVFAQQPLKEESILAENDIAHLPECVKKYLVYTGALGKSRPQNIYFEFDADMYRKPGDKPMKSKSAQYNFFGDYTRIFLMRSGVMGVPFRALHIYNNCQATFRVRAAGLFNVVDIKGEQLTKAETVTVLNDLCIFAPGALADKRLTWTEADGHSAKVTLTNGSYVVSAILYFNEEGALVNFISDDRSALQDDGSLKIARWSTPVGDYRLTGNRMVATSGRAVWHYPEGDFTYGVFTLKNIRYNVDQ